MSTPPAAERGTDWTAVVAIRVPRDSRDDLATNASRRLATGADIASVEVRDLRAIEPGLAATIARLEVRVHVSCALDEEALAQRLAAAPGVERVDSLDTP